MTINEYMTQVHRDCDLYLTQTEKALAGGDWEKTARAYADFKKSTERHLKVEENVLFPEIEAFIGEEGGPTAVMRMEHDQIRQVMEDLESAVTSKDADAFRGASDTFMILLQQHNMKEEQILYPMADQMLADEVGRVLNELQTL